MPRPKKTQQYVAKLTPVDALEDEPEKDAVLDDADSDIQEALQSVAGGVTTVKLYRILPQGGRPKFLTEISPDMFSEAHVQDMYGGGIYKIRARKQDGKWGGRTFEIEGDAKRVQYHGFEEEEERVAPPTNPTPVQQPIVQPPGIDPVMLMQMMQKAQDQGEQRILRMMEMLRPQQQSPDVTKQVFEIVEKIAPMMGGGEGGSPWLAALAQFKEPILKIVDSIQVALTRQPTISGQPTPVQSNPVPLQSTSATTKPTEENMIQLLVRQYLPVFVNAARSGGDAGIYADMVLEQVPQNLYPKLQAWLNGQWFEELKSFDAHIEYQAGWWGELRTYILEGMKPDATSVQSATDSEYNEAE